MRTLIAFTLVALSTAWADQSPYSEGTSKVRLTPAEKTSLLQYAENSKARLEKALKDAEGKSFAETNAIYLKAIKAVVVSSFEQKPRTELLMRIALNQGLELTFGVPAADGRNGVTPGALQGISNKDLLTVILEDSIKLALAYYQDDRNAIQNGNLSDLPYMKQAVERLGMARTWLMSVTEPVSMYLLSVTALQHFMNTAANEDQQHRALYAEELTRVDELLQDNPEAYTTDSKQLMRVIRVLRGEIRRLVESSAAKLMQTGAKVSVPSSTNAGGANSLGMQFVRIQPGTFMMGSPSNEANRYSNETQHQVTLTRAFEIQTTPVTQAQWGEVMGSNPSKFKTKEYCSSTFTTIRTTSGNDVDVCPNHPVETVSWDDAQKFILNLNSIAKDGYFYRLPTEAEWEFAARGGTTTAYSFGDDPNQLHQYAWFDGNSGNQTHEVATRQPNPFGLYDVHGNVWQWVQDFYQESYPSSSVTDPAGPASGSARVARGGGSGIIARHLRSAVRGYSLPGDHGNILGVRLVRTR